APQRGRRTPTSTGQPATASPPGPAGPGLHRHPAALPGRRRDGAARPVLAALALTLLCTAAGGAAAGLHTAAARAGPLPDLAQREAPATVEVTLTGDPRLARPRPSGGPRSLLVDATVDRVEHDGTATDVRTPVLVV